MEQIVLATVAAAAAAEAGTHLVTKGNTVIERVLNFREIIENLKARAQTLEAKKDDLNRSIEASRNNNEIIKKVVTNWLQRTDIVVENVEKLSARAENPRPWYRGCPLRNLFTRNNASKKALKMIGDITGLLEESNNFVEVGDPKPYQCLEIVTAGDFEAFASREDTAKKVVDALKNDQVSMIGIFGMPGVGKTMLMDAIRKQAKDDKLFDEVVLVTVSQNPDIGRIQADIAKQLGLKLGESSVPEAATKLSARLSQGKKVLVAFDDIWERLDMAKVGIPCSIHGCKVLFTTRSDEVCDRMQVREKIEVGVLSDIDAWKLFRQKAGDVVDSSSHEEVARDVCNECKGLPLAIVILGLALKNKKEPVWLDARTRLRRSIYGNGMDQVISIVKFSYDFLHDDRAAQMCFLFCSLFPEDFWIRFDVLLSYMLGEELLRKGDNMEEARNDLHTVIDTLTSSGILLRSERGDNIMMHDVIRDAAIRIASDPKEGEGFIVKSGLGLEEWSPIDGDMEKCKRLSLMSNNLTREGLPIQISASILLTLSLRRNPKLEEIPSDFFKEMKHLRTLDLSETGIKALPESFRCLSSLHTLLMNFCRNLRDISLVGELERLEILSICPCRNVEIPVSLQKLTNLRMLSAFGGIVFPPRVVSSLHRLEELYLGDDNTETDPLVLSEVASLTRMARLEIHLPVECLWENIPTSNLKNLSTFFIAVGNERMVVLMPWGFHYLNHQLGARKVSIRLQSSTQDLESSTWIGVFLEKVEILELYNINRLQNVADHLPNGLSHSSLSELSVWTCKRLKHLLSTTSATTNSRKPLLFSNLQELCLRSLEKFVAICDGPIPEGFLCRLKILEVRYCPTVSPILIPFDLLGNLQKLEQLVLWHCPGLEKLVELDGFSMSTPIFPSLRIIEIDGCSKLKCVIPLKATGHLFEQLEQLVIRDCWNMEMVFEGDDGDKATLPRLKELTLVELPSLSSFGPPSLLFDFPALIHMRVTRCRNLKRFPLLGKQSIPKLKKLDVELDWLNGLECEDARFKDHLKSLLPVVDEALH